MKKYLIILTACILVGCSSLRKAVVVEHSVHDTLYLNRIQFDSVYIDNWHNIDRTSDTVLIREIQREYKYKFLRDTVRIVQVDSIPVIKEVEVTKTVNSIPTIYRISLWTCIGIIVLIILFILLKLFLK